MSVICLHTIVLHMPKRNCCKCNYRRYRGGRTSTGNTRAYFAWKAMRNRIRNKQHHAYHHYGGRGITICERWDDFDNFFEDMGHPPPGLSLDRIDNDGIYEPSNCRWATRSEQNFNRRFQNFLTYEGLTLNLFQWASLIHIKYRTLYSRVIIHNWPAERALFT